MSCDQPNTHALDNSADDCFDPFLYRLYGHFARVCNEAAGGICRQGTRELAVLCQMSTGKVSSARQQLIEMGYITIKEGAGDQPFETSLLERSPHEHYSVQDMNESVSPREQQGVHPMNDTVHEGESVHSMNTNEPEPPSHTGAGAEKQILKSQKTQEQELKEQKTTGAGGEDAGERARIFDQYTALTKKPIESRIVAQQLLDDAKHFKADWIDDAVANAALNGATNWNYVRAILDRWEKEGKETSRPALVKGAHTVRPPNGNGKPVAAPTSEGVIGMKARLKAEQAAKGVK